MTEAKPKAADLSKKIDANATSLSKGSKAGAAPNTPTSPAVIESGHAAAGDSPRDASTALPEESGVKVYFGNLNFITEEDKLKDLAAKYTEVSEVKIVKRFGRSKGYAFVTVDSDADADKLIEELNGQEVDERKILVEKAKPRDPNGLRRFGGRFSGRGRFGRFGRGMRGGHRGRGRGRGRRGGRFGGQGSSRSRSGDAPQSSEPSRRTLYLANLPYALEEDDLSRIFKDFSVSKITIARRSDGASHGYGFITFENEEQQALALKNMANCEIDNRKLRIRVALNYKPELDAAAASKSA